MAVGVKAAYASAELTGARHSPASWLDRFGAAGDTLAAASLVAGLLPPSASLEDADQLQVHLERQLRNDLQSWHYRPAALRTVMTDSGIQALTAEAWVTATARRRSPVRLALKGLPVRRSLDVAGRLGEAAMIGSVSVLDPSLQPDAQWRWPFQVGVLPGSADTAILLKRGWDQDISGFADPVLLGDHTSTCDLLLASGQRGLSALGDAVGVDANCIGLLGVPHTPAVLAAADRAAHEVNASGWFIVSARQPATAWLRRLAAALARNEPLDRALTAAGRRAVLVSHANLLAQGQVSAAPRHLVRDVKLAWGGARGVHVQLLTGTARTLGLRAGPVTFLDLAVSLTDAAAGGDVHFAEAPSFATAVAGLTRHVHQSGVPRRPRRPEPRFLQAEVHAEDGRRRQCAFRHGERNEVVAWIGPGLTNLQAPDPVPEADDGNGRKLVLFLSAWVDGEGLEPQSQELWLPAVGRSALASFTVQVPAGARQVCCDLRLYAEGKQIQAVSLTGPAGTRDTTQAGERLQVKRTLHDPAGAAPAGRKASGSLDVDVTRGVAVRAGDGAPEHMHIPGLSKYLGQISYPLTHATALDATNAEPGSAQQVSLLRLLAVKGNVLFQVLQDRGLGSLAQTRYLQLVSADADQAAPLEWVYDYGRPADNAGLCQNWLAALKTGKCTCRPRRGPARGTRKICPLGFWGIRMVLERSLKTQAGLGRDTLVWSAAQPAGRQPLRPLDGALFAASAKVDSGGKGERALTEHAFRKWLGQDRYHAAAKWPDWKRVVADHSPPLLVSLSHTVTGKDALNDDPRLEIGRQSRLALSMVSSRHVLRDDVSPGPVVLLLGCGTARADISWQSAVAAFQRGHASVVVGTLVGTLGRQSAAMVREIISYLQAHPGDMTFGEIMRDMRRQLMAQGYALALSIVAFGDADTVLPARKDG